MASYFIDSHSHLDLFPNFKQILQKCGSADIEIITVTNAPCVWQTNRALSRNYPRIHAALGFHPQLVKERYREIDLFEQYLKETRFIGEIGLDGSKEMISTFGIQKDIFIRILKNCALEGNKILSIHSRRASKEVIDAISDYFPKEKGRSILHWFTGTNNEALEAVKLGCYFSINNYMITNTKSKDLIRILPPEKILTESDSPFINTPDYPSNIEQIIMYLSEAWTIAPSLVKDKIYMNFKSLLTE